MTRRQLCGEKHFVSQLGEYTLLHFQGRLQFSINQINLDWSVNWSQSHLMLLVILNVDVKNHISSSLSQNGFISRGVMAIPLVKSVQMKPLISFDGFSEILILIKDLNKR